MKRILITLIALAVIAVGVPAQNTHAIDETSTTTSRSEVLTHLASLPDVSVTYLTKSMLRKIPGDKTGSPLAVLVNKGEIESVRVFELGNAEAETTAKRLMDIYISEIPDAATKYYVAGRAELLMLQRNSSDEVLMYGITRTNDVNRYGTVLMYSKKEGAKAIFIILSGNIDESTIGELIDTFSE